MKQTILFFTLIAAALLSACDKNDDSTDSNKLAGTVWELLYEAPGKSYDGDVQFYFVFEEKTCTEYYHSSPGAEEEITEGIPYTYKDGIVRIWEKEEEHDYYAIVDWDKGTMEWHWGAYDGSEYPEETFICYLKK